MTLTGSNTYTGGTTISAGTLMVGSGGTLGVLPGNTLDNSALVFNHADTYTYPGAISGSGSVTQAGSGTLVYLGTNSYSGGTTIGAPGGYPGSLQIGNGGAAGVLPGNTVDNGLLVFSRSDTYTYPGCDQRQRGRAASRATARLSSPPPIYIRAARRSTPAPCNSATARPTTAPCRATSSTTPCCISPIPTRRPSPA